MDLSLTVKKFYTKRLPHISKIRQDRIDGGLVLEDVLKNPFTEKEKHKLHLKIKNVRVETLEHSKNSEIATL